jgi:hypothetical protein
MKAKGYDGLARTPAALFRRRPLSASPLVGYLHCEHPVTRIVESCCTDSHSGKKV